MKANELRVGNFVDEGGYIYPIYSISLKDGEDLYWLSPVPITEEWLLRFGFKRNGNSLYLYPNETVQIINYDLKDSETCIMFFTRTIHTDYTPIYSTEIKYVHQLQNLYSALTGKQLKLKK